MSGYVADWDAPPQWTHLDQGTNGSTSLVRHLYAQEQVLYACKGLSTA